MEYGIYDRSRGPGFNDYEFEEDDRFENDSRFEEDGLFEEDGQFEEDQEFEGDSKFEEDEFGYGEVNSRTLGLHLTGKWDKIISMQLN
jgi:hypothetical protein